VIENYSHENSALPCGTCNSCCRILADFKKGKTNYGLPLVTDYDPGTRVLTHSQSVCSCRICTVANSNGSVAKSMRKRNSRPSEAVPSKKIKICPNSFVISYCGCNHNEALQE